MNKVDRDWKKNGEDFARRSNIERAKLLSLSHAAEGERWRRGLVNLITQFLAIAAIIYMWSSLDVRNVLGIVIAAVIFRAIGNGIVTRWCLNEIVRIKAENPLENEDG